MAKNKDEPLFEEPEFDEREYIESEKERAKAIIFIFIIGAVIGLLSGYFQILGYTYISVILMLVFLVILSRVLKLLGVKLSARASHRIINYGEYILTWMLFWIVFLNPPIHTVSPPQIVGIQVLDLSGTYHNLTSSNQYDFINSYTGSKEYVVFLSYRYPIQTATLNYSTSGNPTITPLSSHLVGSTLYFNLTWQISTLYNLDMYWSGGNHSGNLHFSISDQ
ncbi:MAG: hypothetical protein QW812_00765 [Thermoplasmataceae archaeon]